MILTSNLKDDSGVLGVEIGDHAVEVATIAIERRVAQNALKRQVRMELKGAVNGADQDDNVRVLVLTGARAQAPLSRVQISPNFRIAD